MLEILGYAALFIGGFTLAVVIIVASLRSAIGEGIGRGLNL